MLRVIIKCEPVNFKEEIKNCKFKGKDLKHKD